MARRSPEQNHPTDSASVRRANDASIQLGEPSLAKGARRATVIAFLIIGLVFWLLCFPGTSRFNARLLGAPPSIVWHDLLFQIGIIAAALALSLVPPVRRLVLSSLDRVRAPSTGARLATAVVIAGCAALYFYASAVLQQRVLMPMWHDEQEYRLQTQMLAAGRLWMPPHALGEFFETFYVFTKPVYAVMYFPGTAMLSVPGVWLGLAYWAMPLILASAATGLLYLVLGELIDGAAGLLGAFLLVSLSHMRWLALVEMPYVPAMLFSLVVFWSWLKWRVGNGSMGWLILAGAAAGWCAITRPLDTFCVIGPTAIVWLIEMLRRWPARRILAGAIVTLAAAAPFIAIQLIFDHKITGRLLESPVALYDRTYLQIHGLGFHRPDPNFKPPSNLAQLNVFYYGLWKPQLEAYTPVNALRQLVTERLPTVVGAVLPSSLLLVLGITGVLGLADRRRIVLWIMMPLYLAAMFFYFSFLTHYCTVFLPAAILSVLLGSRAVQRAWPGAMTQTFLPLTIIGLSLLGWPEINGHRTESTARMSLMELNYTALPAAVETPAIVLFTFDTPASVHEEPVYNWDVAWPDDAPIIRAHDLGDRENVKLYRYYAKTQPDRRVYLFDRATRALKLLGRVSDLAAHPPGT